MAKNKLERFAEIDRFENVTELTDFQDGQQDKPNGRWGSRIFQNEHPIILELACGKGHYTLELARRHPQRNFIGVDIKGARIWKGAKRAREEGLKNVHFLRIYIDHLDEYFARGEVSEIWITFPDPYPRGSDSSKRLSSSKFLSIYQSVLKPGGPIHFKTDDKDLFSFTRHSVQRYGCRVQELVRDIYADRGDDPLLTIQTDFEKRHLQQGKTIRYIRFYLPHIAGEC